jgi:hypothetical protein
VVVVVVVVVVVGVVGGGGGGWVVGGGWWVVVVVFFVGGPDFRYPPGGFASVPLRCEASLEIGPTIKLAHKSLSSI